MKFKQSLHLAGKKAAGSRVLILVILTLLMVSTGVLILTKSQLKESRNSLILNAQENKFRVEFNIDQTNQTEFSRLLEKLNLPQSLKEGVDFELDATSSAKLAFSTPIIVNFELKNNKITYEGSLAYSNLPQFSLKNFKIPQDTSLLIAAANFEGFLDTRFDWPKEVTDWINANLKIKEGQYLITFGSDPDFALIFQNPNINFGDLKNLKIADFDQPIYKEESKDNIVFYFLKIPENNQQDKRTLTFFQIDNWIYLVSSFDAAQKLVGAQTSDENQVTGLISSERDSTASLFILFRNFQNDPGLSNLTRLLSNKDFKIENTLKNVQTFKLILKQDALSGLIEVK